MDFYFLPEILVHVFSLIVDPPTLFTVRLVCSAWKVLVDVQIDKIPYISLSNREHLSHFSTYFDQGARDKVSSLILNVPDRDYWSVSLPSHLVYSLADLAHFLGSGLLGASDPPYSRILPYLLRNGSDG